MWNGFRRCWQTGSAVLLCWAGLVQAQPGELLPAPNLVAPPPGVLAPLEPPTLPPAPAKAGANLTKDEIRAIVAEYLKEEMQKKAEEAAAAKAASPQAGEAVAAPALNKTEVRSIISDYNKEEAKKKAAADAAVKHKAEEDGHVVGQNLGMNARWNHGVWFETADKAFKFHLGGRAQYDMVFVDADPNVISANPGGLGRVANSSNAFYGYDDGTNFRRARLTAEGSVWETFNFTAEFDFLNAFSAADPANLKGALGNQANTPVPTDLWVEMTKIPFFGNVRVGNQKPPIGLEHYTSSRFLNFLERSYQFDAYIEDGNNGFSPGITVYNWSEDERWTSNVGWFKTQRNIFGWNVGDGEWSGNYRFGYLPCYEDNGRRLAWFGVSGYFRDLDDDQVRFRARTELRNGNAVLHNVAAFSQVTAEHQNVINPEFTFQWGPFLLNAEYTASWVDNVTAVNYTQGTSALKPGSTYFTQGAYVEVLYFLTGEHRDFNKKSPGYGRVVPFRNAFWVEGENCLNIFSKGAWQVGGRWSYLNLTDTNAGIVGGNINSFTAGLNWFLNPNIKVQWNAEMSHRDFLGSPASGNYWGGGMRFAFDF